MLSGHSRKTSLVERIEPILASSIHAEHEMGQCGDILRSY